MGTARATGPDRAKQAAMQAVRSELLEEENLRTARAVLINITAAEDSMRGREITEIIDTIRSHCSDDVTPIYGTTFDDSMGEDLQVTVIVSGIGARSKVTLAANLPDVGRGHSGAAAGQSHATQAVAQAGQADAVQSQQSPVLFSYRTGTHDVAYTVPATADYAAHSMPLNLDSPNPAIPTLTQEVQAPAGGHDSQTHSVFDSASLMLNPSAVHNPKTDMQNRVKAMQTQGIPTLEIPTFLRNQVN
jgi:FtsZ family, C-terminal domain